VEAFKLVGQINAGINHYINSKLRKLTELSSSDESDGEETKLIHLKFRAMGKAAKRRRIE
jgi:hypothetical protein